jgi:hypothetical protein
MFRRKTLFRLTVTAIVTPTVVVVLLGVAKLLAALGDEAGALCLNRLGLGAAIVWGTSLVFLLLALGVNAANGPD